MKKSFIVICASVSLGVFSNVTNASLISGLGGQVVYDTDLDITWIADADLSSKNTFGLLPSGSSFINLGPHPSDSSGVNGKIFSSGAMNWPGALFWIDAMNDANYLGFNGWRLPSADRNGDGVVVNCSSFTIVPNCFDNELGHLNYDENITNSSRGPFMNVFTDFYWSGTETASGSAAYETLFFLGGGTDATSKSDTEVFAWAVHDGDIAGVGAGVSAVPVPAAAWLFGTGLVALVGVARRKS